VRGLGTLVTTAHPFIAIIFRTLGGIRFHRNDHRFNHRDIRRLKVVGYANAALCLSGNVDRKRDCFAVVHFNVVLLNEVIASGQSTSTASRSLAPSAATSLLDRTRNW